MRIFGWKECEAWLRRGVDIVKRSLDFSPGQPLRTAENKILDRPWHRFFIQVRRRIRSRSAASCRWTARVNARCIRLYPGERAYQYGLAQRDRNQSSCPVASLSPPNRCTFAALRSAVLAIATNPSSISLYDRNQCTPGFTCLENAEQRTGCNPDWTRKSIQSPTDDVQPHIIYPPRR